MRRTVCLLCMPRDMVIRFPMVSPTVRAVPAVFRLSTSTRADSKYPRAYSDPPRVRKYSTGLTATRGLRVAGSMSFGLGIDFSCVIREIVTVRDETFQRSIKSVGWMNLDG